jgi:predicted Rdx family selenoprotein
MPTDVPGLSSDARKQLLYAVRRVLRPIVRLLIRVGMSFDEFANVARGAYIECAIRENPSGIRQTRDRVAFVTGIARHQVDNYIDNEGVTPSAGLPASPTLVRVATEVLHRWHTDPRYLGPYGIPLELQFDVPQGRSFQSLALEVNSVASPGLVLEELLRAGSVTYSGEKHFRAVARWLVAPEFLSPDLIQDFGDTLAHLAQTLEYNGKLADAENKRLERSVFADKGIPRELLSSFEDHARARAMQFLSDIDDWLAHSVTADSSPSVPRMDTGVNVFLYVEPPPDQQKLSALVQPRKDLASVDRSHVA